jgi:hypothetical protein
MSKNKCKNFKKSWPFTFVLNRKFMSEIELQWQNSLLIFSSDFASEANCIFQKYPEIIISHPNLGNRGQNKIWGQKKQA